MKNTDKAAVEARKAVRSAWGERAARLGFVANGILHAMLGFLTLNVALARGGDADQSGAMRTLSAQPGGEILIWICFLGCLLLAVWSLAQAIVPSQKGLGFIVKQAGTGVVFAAIGTTFGSYALGAGKDSSQQSTSISATLMSSPAGSVALIIAGLVVIGVGIYFIYSGVARKFTKSLRRPSSPTVQRTLMILGTAGYVAKGLTLAALGLLIVVSTAQHDPEDSTGLDGALKAVRDQPFGSFALIAIAVGLMAYAVFLFMRSRYDEMKQGAGL
ncbi:MAG: DUF1206 domain-containing protein [Micrococcaceae bacterium]|nr:DUF1206 domain-containing protein [Micrococcaceae bacterium]